jgi:hypothetical protein
MAAVSQDVSAEHPEIVRALEAHADAARLDLGDAVMGLRGKGCREPGRVDNPRPLTQYDPEHPYMAAMYDLPDRG